MSITKLRVAALFAASLGIVGSASAAVLTPYTGGDAGEGLDLDGTFLYAVHTASDLNSYTVRSATFTDHSTPGVTFVAGSGTAFGVPNYGASSNDDAIESVSDFVIYSPTVSFSATGLTSGQQYQLQLLFNESCCNRHFDVTVEGVSAGTDLFPGGLQGAIVNPPPNTPSYNQNVGTVLTYTFTADAGNIGDTTLNVDIVINQPGVNGRDANAMLDAFTLEAVPEPAALSIAGIGALPLLARRRRK